MLGRIIAAVGVMFFFSAAQGATLSFTGAELVNSPLVDFPTVTPTVTGDSLVFGAGVDFEKLLVLQLGNLSSADIPASISISMNMTRLPCDDIGSGACLGGSIDTDPHILVGDGASLVGAVIADNDNGSFLGAVLDDAGNYGANRTLTPIFTDAGFPSANEAFDINVDFTLSNGQTIVAASFLGSFGQFSVLQDALDTGSTLEYIFLRDNDFAEEYQINSLAITTSFPIVPVPIPAAVWLFGSALGILGWVRRKKK